MEKPIKLLLFFLALQKKINQYFKQHNKQALGWSFSCIVVDIQELSKIFEP